MRADALAAQSETDPTAYEQHSFLAREIATVLRRNIVQARKINAQGEDRWRTPESPFIFDYGLQFPLKDYE